MEKQSKVREAARQTLMSYAKALPLLVGVLGLASLLTAALPPSVIAESLPMKSLLGPLIGAVVGSIAAGQPMTSYVLAGEFLAAGASTATVTALVITWVTVGVVQLPAEAAFLGARFAIWRNAISFVLAIVIAYLVAVTVPLSG